jgi:hypothetical protein
LTRTPTKSSHTQVLPPSRVAKGAPNLSGARSTALICSYFETQLTWILWTSTKTCTAKAT